MKDSALFTGVTREMGKRGVGGAPLHIFSCPPGLDLERQPLESKDPKGVSSYVSFPECAPTHTPCPQHFPNLPPGGTWSDHACVCRWGVQDSRWSWACSFSG